MKQLIEEQKKEFEKKYNTSVLIAYPEYMESHMILLTDIWNWHKQSLKQFIDELIGREEKRKSNQKQDNGHDCYDHNCEYCENAIKDNVIEETIAHLKKLKEELN